MKILWLTNIEIPIVSSLLNREVTSLGGWLHATSSKLINQQDISLISVSPSIVNKFESGHRGSLCYELFPSKNFVPKYIESIIIKHKPDLIHIWGTELFQSNIFVSTILRAFPQYQNKIIINIQGLVSIISQHYLLNLPPKVANSYSIKDLILRRSLTREKKQFAHRGVFEIDTIKKVNHFIGRTDWDKAVINLYNPEANYYSVNETLRSSFYNFRWRYEHIQPFTIYMSQGHYPIKGLHTAIQALSLLIHRFPTINLKVISDNPFLKPWFKLGSYEKYILELIQRFDLKEHITFLPKQTEEEVRNQLLNTHIFIVPSTIENESNALSEALKLGVPSIGSFAGGIPSRIIHKETGLLFQPDAPYMLAHSIYQLFTDQDLIIKVSSNAYTKSIDYFNQNVNLNKLLTIYHNLFGSNSITK
jgi:glycosyltransferase involved in cell wall biosynthesis